MSSPWTVTPEMVRMELTYGGVPLWIDLKKELTTGEQRKLDASGFRSVSTRNADDLEVNVHWDEIVFMKVRLYLVDWSLLDDKSQRLPLNADTLRAMKKGVFEVIEKAVDDHVAAMRELEKKAQSGEPLSKTTSA